MSHLFKTLYYHLQAVKVKCGKYHDDIDKDLNLYLKHARHANVVDLNLL